MSQSCWHRGTTGWVVAIGELNLLFRQKHIIKSVVSSRANHLCLSSVCSWYVKGPVERICYLSVERRRRFWGLRIPETISAAAMERMMKLQAVLLKAMAKKISWMTAAKIAGVTVRTMRRIRERYTEHGSMGLFDQRKKKRSLHRIAMETAEEVQRLHRETYFDLNMRHCHEKLRAEHPIEVSYTWVQQALQGAGLVAKRRKRGPHRRRRAPAAASVVTCRWQEASLAER